MLANCYEIYQARDATGSTSARNILTSKPTSISLFGSTEGLLKNELANSHSRPQPNWDTAMVDNLESDTSVETSVDRRSGHMNA